MTIASGPPDPPASERAIVAIWRTNWLPPSETFIVNQIGAMHRWQPLRVAAHSLTDGLGPPPDIAPFGSSTAGRALGKLSARTGYRGVYGRTLRRTQTRLVHAHFGLGAVAALPIARRNRLPLIATFHGFDVTSQPRRSDIGERYRRQLGDVFRYASTLVAVSDYIASQLVELGAPPDKIRVHHIGIPVGGRTRPHTTARSGIAFVGRLVDKKGVDDLLTAITLLPDHLRDKSPLRIIGGGPRHAELRERARSLSLDVEFLGPQPPARVASLLASSSIFCGPSKTAPDGDAEGFGMVFLEAAFHGLPVVSYRHAGVPEAVQDGVTGLLAPEADVHALANHLHTLLSRPDLARQMGRAGHARVVEQFDIHRQTALLEHIYDEAVERFTLG